MNAMRQIALPLLACAGLLAGGLMLISAADAAPPTSEVEFVDPAAQSAQDIAGFALTPLEVAEAVDVMDRALPADDAPIYGHILLVGVALPPDRVFPVPSLVPV